VEIPPPGRRLLPNFGVLHPQEGNETNRALNALKNDQINGAAVIQVAAS